MQDHAAFPHDHEARSRAPAALGTALVLTLGYALVEAVAGAWAGSLALLSDAAHMLGDSASLALAAFAAWAAGRAPSPRHSYGFGRAEVLAALANAALMMGLLVWIAVSAVQRLLEPRAVDGHVVVAVALAGLLVNVAVALILARSDRGMNTRAALLHVMADLLGSVAALVSGAVIAVTGWLPVDSLLSLFICALILFSTLRLLREALHALMEGTPLHLSLEEVGMAMARIEGVDSVHDLHIWTLSSDRAALSAHLVIKEGATWEAVLPQVADLLRHRYGIAHATLQPEAAVKPLRRMAAPR